MGSSSGMAILISLVRLTSSFSLFSTGKVPTFFGCSRSCSDDRSRSSHEFAVLAHPGRCTWSCRRWPDSHPGPRRFRSSVATRRSVARVRRGDQHVAEDVFAGDDVTTPFATAAKTLPGLLAETL